MLLGLRMVNAYRIRETRKERKSRESLTCYLIVLSWKRVERDKMVTHEGLKSS